MRATKRLASSDFNPFTSDSIENKRILVGSPLDTQRAEPSQGHLVTASPQLDMHRAESSRQHVRALNTQFASWIQTQFEKHPDELWEDGIQDYLTHAKSIMEKFSDVVSWLKANATKAENASVIGSDTSQKKFGSESKEKDNGLLFGRPMIPPANTTASSGTSWGSGALFNNSAPFSFGIQSSLTANQNQNSLSLKDGASKDLDGANTTANSETSLRSGALFNNSPPFSFASTTASSETSSQSGALFSNNAPFSFGIQSSTTGKQNQNSISFNDGASEDEDGEDDAEQPSSRSVKKTEEKGIIVVHEARCKLYVKSSDPTDEDPWKQKGTGQLSIKCKEGVDKGTKESKPTIVVRNDVGKVLLNASLYPGLKTNLQKNSLLAIFHTAGDGGEDEIVTARMFSIRTRSEEDRDKLAEAIKEYSPAD